MSGKAVAEFDEADKLLKELDGVLRGEVTAAVADQNQVSNQTLWLFALAVLDRKSTRLNSSHLL